MTPTTARRLCALECAAAAKTKDPRLMTFDELEAHLAELVGHVPTDDELRQMAAGSDTAQGES